MWLCQTWRLFARLSNVYSLCSVWKRTSFFCTHRFVRTLQDKICTSSESDAREWNVCPGNTWKWVKRERSAKHPMVRFQETFVLRRQIVAVYLPFPVDKPHGHFAVPGRCPPSVPVFQQAEDTDYLRGYARSTAKVIQVSKEGAFSFSGWSNLSLDPEDKGTTQLWHSSNCLPACM